MIPFFMLHHPYIRAYNITMLYKLLLVIKYIIYHSSFIDETQYYYFSFSYNMNNHMFQSLIIYIYITRFIIRSLCINKEVRILLAIQDC